MIRTLTILIWVAIAALIVSCIIIAIMDKESCAQITIPNYYTAMSNYSNGKFNTFESRFVAEAVAAYKAHLMFDHEKKVPRVNKLLDSDIFAINTSPAKLLLSKKDVFFK